MSKAIVNTQRGIQFAMSRAPEDFGVRVSMFIPDSEIPFLDPIDARLVKECLDFDSPRSIADRLLGLEVIVRRSEEQKRKSKPTPPAP